METILLTGAGGFFASRLLARLSDKNYNIIALKRSTTDTKRIRHIKENVKFYDTDKTDLEEIYKKNKIDIIIHTATCYGRNNESPDEVVNSNLVYPLKIIELGIKNNAALFINCDTFTKPEYGRLKYYSLTKKHFNEWLHNFKERITVYNLIIHQMYGEDDGSEKFVPLIIKKMLNNEKSIDLTPGEQKRDFIYVEDVCDAFIKLVENYEKNSGYNQFEIGTGISTSIKDVVLLIKKISGNENVELKFGALPYTENEEMNIKAETDDILKKFNWKYKTPVNEGLIKTVNWYKKNFGDKK